MSDDVLFDAKLERDLVAAVIAEPARLADLAEFGAADLTDFHARAAFTAIRNVEARGEWITVDTVRAELDARYGDGSLAESHALNPGWFDALLALPVTADAPVTDWARAILHLGAARQAAVEEADAAIAADRRRRKPPTGPRAANAEPLRLAEAFRSYAYQRGGEATLVRFARAWWRYDGTRYVEHDDESLDRDLMNFLDVVVAPVSVAEKDGSTRVELRRVTAKLKTLGETRKALLSVMPAVAADAPHWTEARDDDPDPGRVVACQNGILNLDTRELLPPTPRLFTTTAVASIWQPQGDPPTAWLDFLESLWGDDHESIRALQQLFGYLLTADTAQQKLFGLIGPPRSGKGTIARVLKALLGDAVVNPTLASLDETFGLAPLVGKTVAVIGDARLGGHTDQAKVVERLLSVSGEDALSINRKNRDAINVRLRTRVVLISNELPRLYDTSGALAARFVLLCLRRSFLGSEDTTLERRLLEELPGILRWAVDGYEDLQEAGRFVTPAASEVSLAHLRAMGSPASVFLEECCEVGAGLAIDVDDLWERYVTWCKENGRERTAGNKQSFGRDLHTLAPEVEIKQFRTAGGRRSRRYHGIALGA